MSKARFNPGDVVVCDELDWGCGTVVKAVNPNIMEVDLGGNVGVRSLSITEHWRLVTEADKFRQVGRPFVPEPCGKPEDATLVRLREEVEGWESSVNMFGAGFDCIDEYRHDLFSREYLHGVLGAFGSQNVDVPDDLRGRIETADRRFVELTRETERDVWGSAQEYDRRVFWYYYRML